MNKKMKDKMYEEVIKARNSSYSPYSNFKVGAVVLLKNGKMITGFNIENAAYGECVCAERNALFRTYMEGYKKEDIESLMVIADTKAPCAPCGSCRQVMSELMELDCEVILSNLEGEFLETSVSKLLPYSFKSSDLDV